MLSRQRSPATAAGKPPSPPLMRRRFSRRSVAEEQPSPASPNVLKDRSTNLGKEPTISNTKRQKGNNKLGMEPEDSHRVANRNKDLDLPDFLLDEDNPFLECHESYSPEAILEAKRLEDERQQEEAEAKFLMESSSTTVSSLSSGSFKIPVPPPPAAGQLFHPAATGHEPTRFVPPKYICIKVQSQSQVPDWLMENKSDTTHQHEELGAKMSMDESECQPQPPQLRYTRQAPPHWSPPLPPSHQYHYPFSSSATPKLDELPRAPYHQPSQQQQLSMTPYSTSVPLSPAPSRHSQVTFHSPYSRATSTMAVALVSPCLDHSYSSHSTRQSRTTIPPPPLLTNPIRGPNRKHKREASPGAVPEPPTPSGSVKRTSPVVQELRSLWSKVRNNNNASAAEISIPDLTMTESTVSPPPHGCLT